MYNTTPNGWSPTFTCTNCPGLDSTDCCGGNGFSQNNWNPSFNGWNASRSTPWNAFTGFNTPWNNATTNAFNTPWNTFTGFNTPWNVPSNTPWNNATTNAFNTPWNAFTGFNTPWNNAATNAFNTPWNTPWSAATNNTWNNTWSNSGNNPWNPNSGYHTPWNNTAPTQNCTTNGYFQNPTFGGNNPSIHGATSPYGTTSFGPSNHNNSHFVTTTHPVPGTTNGTGFSGNVNGQTSTNYPSTTNQQATTGHQNTAGQPNPFAWSAGLNSSSSVINETACCRNTDSTADCLPQGVRVRSVA